VHLKGNYGTAWQNQQKDFDALPAPSPVHDQLSVDT
jgi:hydroxylamine reductase (hybrid-cluster protein)